MVADARSAKLDDRAFPAAAIHAPDTLREAVAYYERGDIASAWSLADQATGWMMQFED